MCAVLIIYPTTQQIYYNTRDKKGKLVLQTKHESINKKNKKKQENK